MYYTYARDMDGNRFLVPFLLGGLAGGAVVGASRPRPIFVNGPQNYPTYQPYPPRPYGGGYYSNSYYGYY